MAYSLLIVLHEAGHAAAARACGLRVFSVEISGIGGLCMSERPPSLYMALVYSSAGLTVQIALLAATLGWIGYVGPPSSPPGRCFAVVFASVNSVMLVMNLIPHKPRGAPIGTDGHLIWTLVLNRIRRRPSAYPDTSPSFPPDTRLASLEGFTPPGFTTGIEVLNDNTTPMEFVVTVVSTQLRISVDEALRLALSIH